MGLFSFSNKNKQEAAGEDSGYFSRDEDSAATGARSKRASSAGDPAPVRGRKSRGAADPVLPEKKRARRRLVGAIALALAVAVGLPMVLDSEPKPLASDIAIQIPSREKAAPLPLPAAPGAAVLEPADSLDQREQFVEAPLPEPVEANTAAEAQTRAEIKTVPVKPAEPKPAEPKPEPKPVARAEPKPAEPKPAEPKPVAKAPAKAEEKAAAKPVKTPEDASRALAILEGKPADKPKPAVDDANPKFVVQVAALASADKVAELQDRLREAGIRSFTHQVPTAAGERIQVKVGPFSREEADKMRARLDKVGLAGSMVRPDGK
jgi:DedD protein